MDTDVCIAGGGPAGMMAGLLFARAGVRTLVLEKHKDFLRDFRGDTVHPSTLRIFHELGLLPAFLQSPHQKARELSARIAGQRLSLADFRLLAGPAPFVALMPQWDFLDFLAEEAQRYPDFVLRRDAEVAGTLEEDGRVTGVRLAGGEEVRARLVIAADGRGSILRSGLPKRVIGAPMDVFWFRLPKAESGGDSDTMGVFETGRIAVLIDRGDYWQCAFVFPKGGADAMRAEGIEAFRRRVAAIGPETAGAASSMNGWDDIKLLTVTVDRLDRWHRPGLLVIGDAAHAMSPIAGVGINLAIQDAVAAANIIAAPMAAGADPDPLLARVQSRRLWPTQAMQGLQKMVQDRVIAPLLSARGSLDRPPLPARLLDRIPALRWLPARIVGIGFRPEHVRSPDAGKRT